LWIASERAGELCGYMIGYSEGEDSNDLLPGLAIVRGRSNLGMRVCAAEASALGLGLAGIGAHAARPATARPGCSGAERRTGALI